MPRLTGTVVKDGVPAEGAYVQIQNTSGDFQGEVRTDEEGRFVLFPTPGRWRLISVWPGRGRGEEDIEVGYREQSVEVLLK
jgi:hypothetical protein